MGQSYFSTLYVVFKEQRKKIEQNHFISFCLFIEYLEMYNHCTNLDRIKNAYYNLPSACCRRRVYSDDVKLLAHDSCKWLISAKKERFSSWTYEVKEQNNRNLVHEGKLIPVNRVVIYCLTHSVYN